MCPVTHTYGPSGGGRLPDNFALIIEYSTLCVTVQLLRGFPLVQAASV